MTILPTAPWNRTFFSGVTSENPQMDQLLQQEPLPPLERRSALFGRTWRQVAYAVAIAATICFACMGVMGAAAFVLLSHPILLPLTIPIAIATLVGLFFCSRMILQEISSRFKTPLAQAQQRVKQAEQMLAKYNQTPSDAVGIKNYITTNGIVSGPEQADQILQKFDKNLDRLRIAIAHYLKAKESASEEAGNLSSRGTAHLEAAFWLVIIQRGGEPLPRKEGMVNFVESPLPAPSRTGQTPPFARIGRTHYATAEDLLNKSIAELARKIGTAIAAS